MADMKKVGTQFVVEGADDYARIMNAAEQQVNTVVRGLQTHATLLSKLGEDVAINWQQFGEIVAKAATGDVQALQQLKEIEAQVREQTNELYISKTAEAKATDAQTEATLKYVDASTKAYERGKMYAEAVRSGQVAAQQESVALQKAAEEEARAFTQRTQEMVQAGIAFGASAKEMQQGLTGMGYSAKQASEILKQAGVDVTILEQAHGRLTESAIHTSRAFFALTLASFGLMTIEKDLKQAFGDDLPQAFTKTVSGLQIIASFGSAGAFSGIPGGAIAGGLIGVLVALTDAALSVDPKIQQLNQSLDNLAKKDEVLTTLQELTNTTRDEAQAMLDVAKASPEAASALRDFLRNIEPANELQLALAGVGKELENIKNVVGKGEFETGLKTGLEAAAPPGARFLMDLVKQLADVGEAARKSAAEQAAADFKVAEAKQKVIDQYKELDATLQRDTVGKDTVQIAELANVTEKAADSFLKFAGSHSEVAQKAVDLKDQMLAVKTELAALEASGRGNTQVAQQLRDRFVELQKVFGAFVLANQDVTDSTDKLTKAQQQLADTLRDISSRAGEQWIKYLQNVGNAQQQFDDKIKDIAQQRMDTEADAAQQRSDRLADIWVQYQNRIVDIEIQLTDRLAQIAQQRTDKLADIQMQLDNRLFDIQQQLGDKLSQIDQDLANKKADLLHQYQDNVSKANDSIKQAAEDLARKLYEIERQRIESIQQLDYNTALQLETAQTDHDRDRILRQRQFELAQINQKANDARNDAEYAYAQKVEQAQKERDLARRNYEYELALAERLAEQKRVEARHAADEQIAQAQRQAQQQIAIANREAEQQRLLAQRQADEQRAQNQRQYEEQRATAERAYRESIARAEREAAQKEELANRELGQRLNAIQQQYDAEVRANDAATQKALDNLRRVIEMIGGVVKAWQAMMEQFGQGGAVVNNLFGNWMKGFELFGKPSVPAVGGAEGLDMLIPQGYPNDTYMIGVSSGERVTVSPANTYNSSARTMNVTIPVYDASDPQRTAQQIKRILNDVAFGMG